MMKHLLLAAALLAVDPAVARASAAESSGAILPVVVEAAERSGDTVTLRWTGLASPVAIYRIDQPDAKPVGQPLARAQGVMARVTAAAWPRPYFLLRDANGQELVTAERVLPFAGGSNFRDLGGYKAAGGRPVVWGQLYRSGVMAHLTDADFAHMNGLGIATVCDLRSTDERSRDLVRWPAGIEPKVLATDYALDMGAIAKVFSSAEPTAESTRSAMATFYRDTPFTYAGQYARMMRELVDGRAPLAFNCSAGKDRTGVAAALLLTLLGVDRETVMADYLLSNLHYRPKAPSKEAAPDPTTAMFARLPREAVDALMGVHRSYLEASFAAIEERGGFDKYRREQLNLSDADVATLRQRYLHP